MWTNIYNEFSFQGYVKPKTKEGSGDSLELEGWIGFIKEKWFLRLSVDAPVNKI